ncbi:MAG: hypothetical protein C5B50_23305 [Verrucomicrobia bacterium]|nr:MAG: hypothetical protein C5B50_23305 [Verrucomicrobiota bacterium]
MRSLSFQQNGVTVLATAKFWDNLNRLKATSSGSIAGFASTANYGYNLANQRTALTNADGAYWSFGYDSLGQVTTGNKHWPDATLVAGEQFGYVFDDIGNRQSTQTGGDPSGANLRQANYSVNNLNQITSRDVPGYLNIMGSADSNATVTVNGQSLYRRGEFYRQELAIANALSPIYTPVTNFASLTTTNGTLTSSNFGSILLPQTPEAFTFDADGNLFADGLWTNAWDGENRLLAIASPATVPDAAKRKLDFTYDWQGRRTQKVVSAWNGSWVPQSTNRFVYDGWNLIAILSSDLSPLASFSWGLDLSGSVQGAGGVGGLLSMTVHSGTNAGTYFYVFDGNGNVMALLNATNGVAAAQYEYGPFGELLRATGPLAQINPFLFSTKFYDWETGLLYYGHRYHSPGPGRWLSRDPIEEKGGRNLYAFVLNRPIGNLDMFGLTTPVQVLDVFFGPFVDERLWVMDENDEYTQHMRQWSAVQQALDKAKADLKANCAVWKSKHQTSAYWHPYITSKFDPDRASFIVPVGSPDGTDPLHAATDYAIYKLTGHITDNLWYSSVGSFTVCITVDSVDCCKDTAKAKLNIWVYNCMSKRSFGFPAPFSEESSQYEWWHWKEDYDLNSGGANHLPTKGGGSWGGT